MAPMMRCRAADATIPGPLAVTWHPGGAPAGLIMTEGSLVSPRGAGLFRTPRIFSREQAEGGAGITWAVQGAGGRIFLQLGHVGRMSHPDLPGGGGSPGVPLNTPDTATYYAGEERGTRVIRRRTGITLDSPPPGGPGTSVHPGCPVVFPLFRSR